MANIAFSGEKASQNEVKKALMAILADSWPEAFTDKLPLKFMGWRLVILKVPIGHVKVFHS